MAFVVMLSPEERRKKAQAQTSEPGGGFRLKKGAMEAPRKVEVGKMVKAPHQELGMAAEKASDEAMARLSKRQMAERVAEERALEGRMRGMSEWKKKAIVEAGKK